MNCDCDDGDQSQSIMAINPVNLSPLVVSSSPSSSGFSRFSFRPLSPTPSHHLISSSSLAFACIFQNGVSSSYLPPSFVVLLIFLIIELISSTICCHPLLKVMILPLLLPQLSRLSRVFPSPYSAHPPSFIWANDLSLLTICSTHYFNCTHFVVQCYFFILPT